MQKGIIGLVAALLLVGSFFVGTVVGNDKSDDDSKKSSTQTSTTTTKAMTETTAMMKPEKLELDEDLPTPTATIVVKKDAKMGYNLQIKTTNFTFTPQNANTDKAVNPQNEGHTHLYVNGKKITRVYSEYFYMPAEMAKAGDEVYVTLNTDKHLDIVDSNKVTLD